MSFASGFTAPYRGALFIHRHALWRLALFPLLLSAGSATGFAWLLMKTLVNQLQNWPALGVSLLFVLGLLILSVILFFIVQPLFAAPFLDLLCERTETIAAGQVPKGNLRVNIQQAILHGIGKTALYALGMGLSLVLTLALGFGAVLGSVLWGIFLVYDAFDYPLARRHTGFAGKWRYLTQHALRSAGFACGSVIIYVIPVLGLLAPAFAAVGATLLFLETREHKPLLNPQNSPD